MNLPQGTGTLKEFFQAIADHEKAHYEKKGAKLHCTKCKGEIEEATIFIPIHFGKNGTCTNTGQSQPVAIPYCPSCEGKPKKTGSCIHM